MYLTLYAIAPGSGPLVLASEIKGQSIIEPAVMDVTGVEVAQFELPKSGPKGEAPEKQLPQRLKYQYGYGSESEVLYRLNPDLNSDAQDNLLILAPELHGYVTYRPADWIETTLEMILQWEIDVQEPDYLILPDGEIKYAEKRGLSLLVDQAYVTLKNQADLTLGRRNFEDDRHWLYDTSMDVGLLSLRSGKFRVETSLGRQALFDLDAIRREVKDRINTFITYGEYRGIENIKLAGYVVHRHDLDRLEGRPLLMGLRSLGHPTYNISYWADLALLRGEDEAGRDFSSAYGLDIGATYRFPGLPLHPNLTFGFALGTGDENPDDNKNNEFRQTDLQSNETRFAGIPEFKIYGEALDPELSNLKIFTVALGFQPAQDFSVDFVYHHYRLDTLAEELRNSAITAQMNQVDGRLSKDVGNGFDVVLGFRNLFGVRRLGLDLRAGWFFPGQAFLRDEGDEDNPIIRDPDNGFTFVAKFWW